MTMALSKLPITVRGRGGTRGTHRAEQRQVQLWLEPRRPALTEAALAINPIATPSKATVSSFILEMVCRPAGSLVSKHLAASLQLFCEILAEAVAK